MSDIETLVSLLESKNKLLAMIAPSFPIVFKPSSLITRLRKLGFSYVIEVTVGAKRTNEEVVQILEANPNGRFITSPCASFVRFIRTRYPSLLPFLAFKADSPMIATTKIAKELYPNFLPVFIGPCIVKKLEAKEDYPELNILVLTYKELIEVFERFNIKDEAADFDHFDLAEKSTRIYPTDGGLTITAGLSKYLKPDEIKIVSGWKNIEPALKEFQENSKIRFMDVLFCDEGCINGPGIVSKLTLPDRRKAIFNYASLPAS